MTGKQFAALIARLFGDRLTTEQAATALACSKRTVERYRKQRKVPPLVARELARIEEDRKAPDYTHKHV